MAFYFCVYEKIKIDSDSRIVKKKRKINEESKKCEYCGIKRSTKQRACCNHTNEYPD